MFNLTLALMGIGVYPLATAMVHVPIDNDPHRVDVLVSKDDNGIWLYTALHEGALGVREATLQAALALSLISERHMPYNLAAILNDIERSIFRETKTAKKTTTIGDINDLPTKLKSAAFNYGDIIVVPFTENDVFSPLLDFDLDDSFVALVACSIEACVVSCSPGISNLKNDGINSNPSIMLICV
jgi:hypothetical protein